MDQNEKLFNYLLDKLGLNAMEVLVKTLQSAILNDPEAFRNHTAEALLLEAQSEANVTLHLEERSKEL